MNSLKEIEFDIDYSMFSVPETIVILNFFQLIASGKYKTIKKETLKAKYLEYRSVVNSIQLEKQFDKMLVKKAGVSIYQTMKPIVEGK